MEVGCHDVGAHAIGAIIGSIRIRKKCAADHAFFQPERFAMLDEHSADQQNKQVNAGDDAHNGMKPSQPVSRSVR